MAEVRAFHALRADFQQGPDLAGAHRRVRDREPAIFQLRQSFEHGGRTLARRGIVAAVGLATSGTPALLPHEPPDPQTMRRRLEQIATSRVFDWPLLVLHPGDLGEAELALAAGRERRADAAFPGTDVLVFGHSHIPWDTVSPAGMRLINPGSPTDRRRQPECTMMIAEVAGTDFSVELIPVDRTA